MEIPIQHWWLGIITYALVHLLHLFIWHANFKSRGTGLLFMLFIGLPTLGYLLAVPFFGWKELLVPFLVHWVFSSHYLSFYPVFQASSPSIDMLALLQENTNGLSRGELVAQMAKQGVVDDRVNDLTKGNFLVAKEGRLVLTKRGNLLASFFLAYRSFMGLPKGEG